MYEMQRTIAARQRNIKARQAAEEAMNQTQREEEGKKRALGNQWEVEKLEEQ